MKKQRKGEKIEKYKREVRKEEKGRKKRGEI